MPSDATIRAAVREAATRPAAPIHHALRALELIGLLPAQVRKEALQDRVSAQLFNHWRAERRPIPEIYHKPLYNYAAQAVLAAVDVIGETAKEHPDLVTTQGFANFCRKIMLAKNLMLELEVELRKQHEGKANE